MRYLISGMTIAILADQKVGKDDIVVKDAYDMCDMLKLNDVKRIYANMVGYPKEIKNKEKACHQLLKMVDPNYKMPVGEPIQEKRSSVKHYDNEGNGALYSPKNYELEFVGKICVDNTYYRIAVIDHTDSETGEITSEVFAKIGKVAARDKTHESQPDFVANVSMKGRRRIAGWWKKAKTGIDYLSLAMTKKDKSQDFDIGEEE